MVDRLKAPFPYFGGKSRVADIVWRAFGNCPNYCEPFAGSLAVLLARPHDGKIETVNDLDAMLANFWRAVQHDPEAVADAADWPVSEPDLHARHRWLVDRTEFRARMMEDPDLYDAKIAGWWVWGLCQWMGTGWCAQAEPSRQLPALATSGGSGLSTQGVRGAHRLSTQLPALSVHGRCGVHAEGVGRAPLPSRRSTATAERGVTGGASTQGIRGSSGRMPTLGHSGRGIHSPERDGLIHWFTTLQSRLRRVRVACGDWSRIVSGSVTGASNTLGNMGMQPCGVFLDPPYDGEGDVYATDVGASVSGAVREWAIANGDSPALRIALCGYAGEHAMPESWTEHAWKAQGGYGNRNGAEANENARRERIWFSPHCLPLVEQQASLFGGAA